jgi:hypothetical protein
MGNNMFGQWMHYGKGCSCECVDVNKMTKGNYQSWDEILRLMDGLIIICLPLL